MRERTFIETEHPKIKPAPSVVINLPDFLELERNEARQDRILSTIYWIILLVVLALAIYVIAY